MSKLLEIRNLNIKLKNNNKKIISDVGFELSEGDSMIVLGQSGSGKTILCRTILNILDKNKFLIEGSSNFDNFNLLNISQKEKKLIYGSQIAYIPQNPMTALDPSMKIGKQLDETLRLHSELSKDERYSHILNSLKEVGLKEPERVYSSYPFMMSGGMLQRTIIAMAMMLNARLLIADEPTTALDVVHRNGIMDLFKKMKDKGTSIMMVTHDFATALQLGGKIIVMKDGVILESGNVDDVFKNSKEDYTKALIDAYSLSSLLDKEGVI